MAHIKKYLHAGILGVLLILTGGVWYAAYWENRGDVLTVAFLNIGQGDAIFIEAPNGNQVVVDGGPDSSILRELGKLMPYYDRSLDMLIVTNPDKDHFAGFIDILDRYSVGEVLEPGTLSDSATYAKLEDTISDHHVKKTLARRGMRVVLDPEYGVFLDILFPDRDVSTWATNDGSIVARLSYGSTSYLLTGDATKKTEGIILNNGDPLQSTVLKVGHHGSKTSTGASFVQSVAPAYAVISAGFHNKYKHPHPETLSTLAQFKIPTLITFERGTIVTVSDGQRLRIK